MGQAVAVWVKWMSMLREVIELCFLELEGHWGCIPCNNFSHLGNCKLDSPRSFG